MKTIVVILNYHCFGIVIELFIFNPIAGFKQKHKMHPTPRAIIFLIMGILLAWVVGYFNGLLALLILAFGLLIFFKDAPRKLIITTLVCPVLFLFTWNFGQAFIDYTAGSAKMKFYGHPINTYVNINEEYRLHNDPQGCKIGVYGFPASIVYNKSVKGLIDIFGFQRSSYTGKILNKEEALSLLLKAEAQSCEIEFVRNKELVFFRDSVLLSINLKEQESSYPGVSNNTSKIANPKIYFQDELAITQFNQKWIYLIDTRNAKIIKYYETNS